MISCISGREGTTGGFWYSYSAGCYEEKPSKGLSDTRHTYIKWLEKGGRWCNKVLASTASAPWDPAVAPGVLFPYLCTMQLCKPHGARVLPAPLCCQERCQVQGGYIRKAFLGTWIKSSCDRKYALKGPHRPVPFTCRAFLVNLNCSATCVFTLEQWVAVFSDQELSTKQDTADRIMPWKQRSQSHKSQ